MDGRFTMLVSRPLLEELADVIQRPKLAPYFPDPLSLVLLIEAMGVIVEPMNVLDEIPDDPDDNRVLEAAQTGHADVIVSGDKHLLDLIVFDGIAIIRPAAFLARF